VRFFIDICIDSFVSVYFCEHFIRNLHLNPLNPIHNFQLFGQFVKGLPKSQLERLVCIIRDKLSGMSLEASLARNEEVQKIDSDEDLNKVDPELLQRKKTVILLTFA
jgi:hypothetical protein